jgi:type IV pilus assembly protein PilW
MNRSAVTMQTRQQGFSIVELLVAMTLSLILMAGVLSLVYSSKITYLENERIARNQEGGRAAFEMILRDVRSAGFQGCAQPILFTMNNRLTNPGSLLWNFGQTLQGYEGSSGTFSPTLDPVLSGATPAPSPDNDILVVRTIRTGAAQFATPATTPTGPTDDIVVTKKASQKVQGTTFVISDCAAESFFVASQIDDGGTTATLKRTTGGTEPTNDSDDLFASFDGGAQVAPVDTVIYYIAPGSAPAIQGAAAGQIGEVGPSLWRIIGSVNGGNPQEVIPGVERMELQYGVDTDGDAVVDEYDNADVVDAAGNWNRVISARVAILVRSPQANSPDVDGKTYTLLGKTAGPFNDRYERQVFTTTVTLRNQTT